VDMRIGVTYSARELEVPLPDDVDRAGLMKRVEDVLAGTSNVLWVTDRRGRDVAVPADKIAYVEIGSETDSRPMGFSS
jgi:hypothetical protein